MKTMFKNQLTLSIAAASVLVGCGQGPSTTPIATGTVPSIGFTTSSGPIERGFGFDFNKQGLRDITPQQTLFARVKLPASVDLRGQTSPVGDQGKLGSCTAWAMGRGLNEFLEIKQGKELTTLSPLYLYYKEREMDGNINQDTGSTITTGMTVLKDIGEAPEADMPYDITKFTQAPSAEAESHAPKFKIAKKLPLNNLEDIKTSIAQGYPAAFGFMVFASFKKIGPDGVMPMPKPWEQLLGGHAVLAVGYDDAKQAVIVRNSWSDKWGDKGNFYMPYKYFTWGRVRDIWSAR